MSLHVDDIEKIYKFLKENNDIQYFKIIKSGEESGIGYNIELEHSAIIDNRPTRIITEISGVENW